MAVVLSDLLDEKHIALDLKAQTKEEALREIVKLMRGGIIEEPQKFLAAVMTRENSSPTLAENGIAFPHARTGLVKTIVLGVGRSAAGIPFGKNGEPAFLIFVIGVPQQMIQDYLVCVGTVARLVREKEMRVKLLAASTAEEFASLMRDASLLLK